MRTWLVGQTHAVRAGTRKTICGLPASSLDANGLPNKRLPAVIAKGAPTCQRCAAATLTKEGDK